MADVGREPLLEAPLPFPLYSPTLPRVDPDSFNQVAKAVDIASALVDAHTGHSAVWPDDITEAVDAITVDLVAAGISQRRAELAVTKWLITKTDIWVCAAEVDDGGPVQPRA